eukprot:scaffold32122_cov37-Prasinocladus_malaysianus.AAC.1
MSPQHWRLCCPRHVTWARRVWRNRCQHSSQTGPGCCRRGWRSLEFCFRLCEGAKWKPKTCWPSELLCWHVP